MYRPALASTSLAFALLLAPAARADEDFGKKVSVAISAERLFGLNVMRNDIGDNPDTTDSYTQFSLFLGEARSPYDRPRVAVDVFFGVDGLSVGGALGLVTASGERDQDGRTRDLDSSTGVLLAPRVGYAYMFTSLVGVWGRGGFTYYNFGTRVGDDFDATIDGASLNLEPMLVLSPLDHVAFTFGTLFDIPVAGERSWRDDGREISQDYTWFNFSLSAGMVVFF